MTDRKLLKQAAKAACIDGFWVDDGLNTGSNASPVIWNPLTNDGDALRLAVKLKIIVTFTDSNGPQVSSGQRLGSLSTEDMPIKHFLEQLESDCAATRRAIVRASAEIGRKMK